MKKKQQPEIVVLNNIYKLVCIVLVYGGSNLSIRDGLFHFCVKIARMPFIFSRSLNYCI